MQFLLLNSSDKLCSFTQKIMVISYYELLISKLTHYLLLGF